MKHLHWTRRLAAGLLALCCLLAAGCGKDQSDPEMAGWEKYSAYWFDVFDTVTILTGYAPSQEEWDRQAEALHEDLVYYHKLFDIYNTYEGVNNLATVNAAAGTEPVAVDEPVLDLLEMALKAYELTGGKMNVAAGSMLGLWHDYRTAGLDGPENAALPPMDQLEAAMDHVDPANVHIDREAGTVQLTDPAMRLDVGSVGKGYAVEQVAQAAEARGLTSFLLSVGGNLRGVGHKPDGTAWTGGVENPWTEYHPPLLPVFERLRLDRRRGKPLDRIPRGGELHRRGAGGGRRPGDQRGLPAVLHGGRGELPPPDRHGHPDARRLL